MRSLRALLRSVLCVETVFVLTAVWITLAYDTAWGFLTAVMVVFCWEYFSWELFADVSGFSALLGLAGGFLMLFGAVPFGEVMVSSALIGFSAGACMVVTWATMQASFELVGLDQTPRSFLMRK